jgi:nucleotide-binding universal stress UspA family protein
VSAAPVVVAYDGSPSAGHALRWGSDEARLQGRPLTLVHVTPHRARGERVLRTAYDEVLARFPGQDVELVVRGGDPRRVLPDVAGIESLLIVGTRGWGHVKSLLLGSVSSALVRTAPGPVVVAHAPACPRLGVLVATDHDADLTAAVEAAFREASWRHLDVTVVHCTWDGSIAHVGWDVARPGDAGEMRARAALSTLVGDLRVKFPDVRSHGELLRGDPVACIADLSRRHDLVVVGRPVGGAPRSALAVVEHAHSTVLVVP